MGIFDYFTNPQQAVTDVANNVTSRVTDAGRGAVSNIFSLPGKILSGITGSLWNGVKYTAIIMGIQALAPEMYNKFIGVIEGPEALARLKANNGGGSLIVDSAKEGFGAAAVLGAAGGVSEGLGGGIVGMAGAGIAMAAVVAVGMGAIHKGDVRVAASNDGNTAVPPTPAGTKPKAEPAKGA